MARKREGSCGYTHMRRSLPMRSWLPCVCVLVVCIWTLAGEPSVIPTTQSTPAVTLEGAKMRFDLAMRNARQQYLHDLDNVLRNTMKAGDLQGANRINAEIQQ